MYVLGISAYYHDSAAALLRNGNVVCAIEEERLSRIKHDNQFPERAIAWCLAYAGIQSSSLSAVAYYEKPLRRFERILETFVDTYPYSWRAFVDAMPEWLGVKIRIEQRIAQAVGSNVPVYFVPHHRSHAAAAFYASPYERAAVLTVDGVGEYETTGLWHGHGTRLQQLRAIDFPNSLGLFYSAMTAFLGFRVNEGEYKVMGLAAHGTPRYADTLRRCITAYDDGSFALSASHFSFYGGARLWRKRLERILGLPRRDGEPITQRHADIAASVQRVTEEVYLGLLCELARQTDERRVCIAGGVALNALANGRIGSETPFTDAYIMGAAGDAGAAIGAAYAIHHDVYAGDRGSQLTSGAFGSEYADADIVAAFESLPENVEIRHCSDTAVIHEVVRVLAAGGIVGWFQGSMEFGPRALGHRSILAAPAPAEQAARANTIKHRDSFRPFGVSILEEDLGTYFYVPLETRAYPFMNVCFQAKPERREEIAAVVHVDDSSRVQTVPPEAGRYRALLEAFKAETGTPCLLNTSFNGAGEPIVETPAQAVAMFAESTMDVLAIGNYVLQKYPDRE